MNMRSHPVNPAESIRQTVPDWSSGRPVARCPGVVGRGSLSLSRMSPESHKFFRVFVVAATVAALAGCSPTIGSRRSIARSYPHRSTANIPRLPAATDEQLAQGHYLKGLVAVHEGDNDKALYEMRRAAKLEPSQPRIRIRLIDAYVKAGKLDDAAEQAIDLISLEPERPEHRLLGGGLLSSLGRTREAIDQYEAYLLQVPSSMEALVKLASLYGKEEEYAKSIELLSRAAQERPDEFILHSYLGRYYALSLQYDEALRAYRAAAELNPSSDQVYLEMGFVHEQRGSKRKAIENYRKALKYNPHSLPARRQLGGIYVAEGKLEDALNEYEQLITLEEDPLLTQTKIGLISLENRDFHRAAMEFNMVLGARPDDHDVRFYLGVTYDRLGQVQAADREYRRVPPSSDKFDEARLQLGQLHFRNGDVAGAIDSVEDVLKVEPENVTALRLIIDLEESVGNFERALEYGVRLVATDPANDTYMYRLAWVHQKSGDREQAIAVLLKTIELNPENGDALNFLGYTYAETGKNLDEAQALITRALALLPNNGFIVDSLGWVHYQRGEFKEAVAELERAARMVGNDPVISEHLADAYVKVGRASDALRLYRDCEARTENPEQRTRVNEKLIELESRAQSSSQHGF